MRTLLDLILLHFTFAKRTSKNGIFFVLIFFIEPGLISFARLERSRKLGSKCIKQATLGHSSLSSVCLSNEHWKLDTEIVGWVPTAAQKMSLHSFPGFGRVVEIDLIGGHTLLFPKS